MADRPQAAQLGLEAPLAIHVQRTGMNIVEAGSCSIHVVIIANIDLTDLDALPKDNSKSLFKRLDSADHARIEASVIDIRRERDTRYAPFLEALIARGLLMPVADE